MPAGRPRIYESVEELETAIEDYFNPEDVVEPSTKCGQEEPISTGRRTKIAKPTVTGLALSLGFASKQSLYDYAEKEEFSYPIKKALTRIEQYHEEGLSEGNVAGRIFALKNMGWKDKVETEHSGNMSLVWQEQKTYDSNEKTNQSS